MFYHAKVTKAIGWGRESLGRESPSMRLAKAPLILATATMIKIQDLIEHEESAETHCLGPMGTHLM